jgi:hypothetical protein
MCQHFRLIFDGIRADMFEAHHTINATAANGGSEPEMTDAAWCTDVRDHLVASNVQ